MHALRSDGVHFNQGSDWMAYRDLFDDLMPRERVQILQQADECTFDSGMSILVEGGPNSAIFVILEGEVEILRAGVRLATLGLGSIFGEMAFLTSEAASATVRAIMPTTVLRIQHEHVWGLISAQPEFGTRFYRSIATTLALRLRSTSDRLRGVE